jgi:copper homeostasis protein
VKTIIRETCVESREEIDTAARGGAQRIELCSCLELGGLTPPLDLADYAISKNLEVAAMIRTNGTFAASAGELEKMKSETGIFRESGVKALVLGFLTGNGEIDFAAIKSLIALAGDKQLVFHMAFDEIPAEKQMPAIDALAELGFARILTKGGRGKAINNIERLKTLNEYAAGKITILCGGGVTDGNYMELAGKTSITQFHGRKLGCGYVE